MLTSTIPAIIAPAVPARHPAAPANGMSRLRAAWHSWRLHRARNALLVRAAALEASAPSYAADMRAAAKVL